MSVRSALTQAVFPWLYAAPFLERTMERARFLEAQQAADVGHAEGTAAQVVNGCVAPQLVLDPLEARSLGDETPPQRGRRHVKVLRDVLQSRPLRGTDVVAHPPTKTHCDAVLVLVRYARHLAAARPRLPRNTSRRCPSPLPLGVAKSAMQIGTSGYRRRPRNCLK